MCSMVTQGVPIGGILVLVPADQAVVVDVKVAPLTLHTLINVFPLSIFDPNLQLVLRHKAVFVAVNPVHDDTAETNTWRRDLSTGLKRLNNRYLNRNCSSQEEILPKRTLVPHIVS